MTTISMNTAAHFYAGARAPRRSFAARLAALQARHEQAEPILGITGVALRVSLALVPFTALAWVFYSL
jgi:hypothetical protein